MNEDLGNDMLRMLKGIFNGPISRVDKTNMEGFTVSTIETTDCGFETAIMDIAGIYPVERYENEELAREGHERWVEKCRKGLTTVIRLGYGTSVEDKKIKLVPKGLN